MLRLITAAGLAITALFPAAAFSMNLEVDRPSAQVVRYGIVEGRPASSGGGSGNPPSDCSDKSYEFDPASFKLEGTFAYYLSVDTKPSDLLASRTETAMKEAFSNWAKAKNSCGLADDVSVSSSYKGHRDGAADITNDGRCKASDGKSEIAFGALPSSYVALTCVWYVIDGPAPYRLESADIRLSTSKKWRNTTSGCKSRYIVESVLTHEIGHLLGLSHHKKVTESAHGNLSMSPLIDGYCQLSETTLGKGDVIGLRARGY
jgi:hypothetical protein